MTEDDWIHCICPKCQHGFVERDRGIISKAQHQKKMQDAVKKLNEWVKISHERAERCVELKTELSDLKKEYNEALENTADKNYQIGLEQGKKELKNFKELVNFKDDIILSYEKECERLEQKIKENGVK